jgi:hypothetical protein
MQLSAPTSTNGNDSDLSLTTGFLSESSASESEEDVLIHFAAAGGAAAASFCTGLARVELQKSRGGSQIGRLPNRDRGHAAAVVTIDSDYFCRLPFHTNVQPYFDENEFRLHYRVSRDLCKNVRRGLLSDWHDTYFQQRLDACGLLGASTDQKTTAAFRTLAYGNSADIFEEYGRLAESTNWECLKKLCQGIVDLFEDEWLRLPRDDELQRLSREYASVGFPGC